MFKVHEDQFDSSIRHTVVKEQIIRNIAASRKVHSLPLAVERRQDNPDYVTWSATDTVFGNTLNDPRFELWQETRVTRLLDYQGGGDKIAAVLARRLSTDDDVVIISRVRRPCQLLMLITSIKCVIII
jgi:pyranose oxidase